MLFASTLFAQAIFSARYSAVHTTDCKRYEKFLYNSIHKLPTSIRFSPIKHAFVVTVDPFKFSSRQIEAAYELSYFPIRLPVSISNRCIFCGGILRGKIVFLLNCWISVRRRVKRDLFSPKCPWTRVSAPSNSTWSTFN